MKGWLIAATVVEILLVAVVLVVYLSLVARSLRRTSRYLGKVAFGVRAIETQCEVIGPAVTHINGQLTAIAGALDGVAGLTEAAVASVPSRPSRRSSGRG